MLSMQTSVKADGCPAHVLSLQGRFTDGHVEERDGRHHECGLMLEALLQHKVFQGRTQGTTGQWLRCRAWSLT